MNSKDQTKQTYSLNEHLQIHFDQSWITDIKKRFESNGPWDDWNLYQLAYESGNSRLITDFDELQSLYQLSNIEPMPHQISTAKKVLTEMRGRAILADEVGLGKTIEAGLILKEYMIRQLVKKVLILVPASLVLQWVRELNQKFNIPAVAQKKAYMWDQYDIIVASVDTAKRNPHRDIVLDKEYDMLIVDEAHKLKNKKTTNYQFINSIRKKYCLLLTATPIQNDLKELYNLITILKPGQLGNDSQFKSNYVVDKRIPKNESQLREELTSVMIRNRRSDGQLDLTKRNVRNIPLKLSEEEYDLYTSVTDFVRKRTEENNGAMGFLFSLITLQREVCSSRDAVFVTLVNLFKKTTEDSPIREMIWALVDKIKKINSHTKAKSSLELVQQINDKVIIFTEYRATQEYLLNFLKEHQIVSVPYRGGMNRGKKDWMMDLFRKRAQVMVATEAGGEGINLQFCNHVINYDLPWNPMRVEQRIGRVHRLGQKNDVHIYNLFTKGTIEEHILHLLHEKINLFETVVGGLDLILERLEKNSSIEKNLYKIILESQNEREIHNKFNELGDSFSRVQTEVYGEKEFNQIEPEASP
ncbi:DEAD/DEAH box helicase [Chengkuizengella axinellae]|uniref:SNF2-related protein n=1 Tax=Chengkuizengella axinellae TaxID=3064388 RepID=A0ABT9IYY7_9BACL|nr:SNF2-related protein [Chengkuizengella sp. 2205SS18-9]MDP5274586.1 SNF2-related protein [Chengkuizengella sp. 2205SS18-9]